MAASEPDDARLVAAMEQIAQGNERVRLQRGLENLARAEEEVAAALRGLGHRERSHEMYERAVAHFQEAAQQARALADVRRKEREVLDGQKHASPQGT